MLPKPGIAALIAPKDRHGVADQISEVSGVFAEGSAGGRGDLIRSPSTPGSLWDRSVPKTSGNSIVGDHVPSLGEQCRRTINPLGAD